MTLRWFVDCEMKDRRVWGWLVSTHEPTSESAIRQPCRPCESDLGPIASKGRGEAGPFTTYVPSIFVYIHHACALFLSSFPVD